MFTECSYWHFLGAVKFFRNIFPFFRLRFGIHLKRDPRSFESKLNVSRIRNKRSRIILRPLVLEPIERLFFQLSRGIREHFLGFFWKQLPIILNLLHDERETISTHYSGYGDLSCSGQRQIVREYASVQRRAQMCDRTRRFHLVPPHWTVGAHYKPLVFAADHAHPKNQQIVNYYYQINFSKNKIFIHNYICLYTNKCDRLTCRLRKTLFSPTFR